MFITTMFLIMISLTTLLNFLIGRIVMGSNPLQSAPDAFFDNLIVSAIISSIAVGLLFI